jgi:hypothetical protein
MPFFPNSSKNKGSLTISENHVGRRFNNVQDSGGCSRRDAEGNEDYFAALEWLFRVGEFDFVYREWRSEEKASIAGVHTCSACSFQIDPIHGGSIGQTTREKSL